MEEVWNYESMYCRSNFHDDQNTTKHIEIWSIWKKNKTEDLHKGGKKTIWY